MSFDQIGTFLRCFNAAVREKVLDPSRREPSPQLIENLRRACQYERPAAPQVEALEVFSADRYAAAERFWLAEYADAGTGRPSPPAHAGAPGASAAGQAAWRSRPAGRLSRQRLEALERGCGIAGSSVLLSAVAAALLRLDGRDDTAVVAAPDAGEPFPVRLRASERLGFRDLARLAHERLTAARPHRRFGPRIFSGVFRMPGYLKAPPRFELGYLEVAAGAAPTGGSPLDRFADPAFDDLALVLVAERREDGLELRLCHREGWPPERVEELGETLLEILDAAAADAAVHLGDVPIAALARHPAQLPGSAVAVPQFNF
jgi:hypothetical protein